MGSKMKSISRFTGLLGRSKSVAQPSTSTFSNRNFDNAPADSPEANVGTAVRLFCESGSMSNGGEEVLHLPVIVEAAESSPSAAAAAAQQIRKFLSREWASKPYVQYNSIMLVRILSDNPGPSFTRNFDKSFVSTVKEVLRNCKDGSTQQILRETLDSLEANKQYQDGMEGLIQMWRKEKGGHARLSQGYSGRLAAPGAMAFPQQEFGNANQARSGQHQSRSGGHRQLPSAVELASRIEEARNTAKILLQLISSTPPEELLNNDLIREFADRCQSAQRSMQEFISCDQPAPDDDTMLTLIETNEQLSLASTRYQRSVLTARRALGVSPSPNAEVSNPIDGPYAPPPGPPTQNENLFASNSPQRPTNEPSAFATRDETYQAPQGPPPPRSAQRPVSPQDYDASYQPPSGPPPAMLARLNSREGQSPAHSPTHSTSLGQPPQLPSLNQPSDPFADPMEHDRNPAPLAYDSSTFSRPQHPANRPHSQTFSIDTEPSYASGFNGDTSPPNDVYRSSYNGTPQSGGSPPIQSQGFTGSSSSQRPAPGPWHNAAATPSYIGRQTSAVNGLTMHGAGDDNNVPEIDGHSEVGRIGPPPATVERSNTTATQSSGSAYSVSPVEARRGGNSYYVEDNR